MDRVLTEKGYDQSDLPSELANETPQAEPTVETAAGAAGSTSTKESKEDSGEKN